MDMKALQAAFTSAGLARLVKDIPYIARPAIRLTTASGDEAKIAVGASKFGGQPDLPAGVQWPTWQNLPQSFIAQIQLADAHPFDEEHLLPENGMLWFFYDAQQQTFGEQPADRGGWTVLFQQAEHLQRTPFPKDLPAESRFKACTVTFSSEITLAQDPRPEIPHYDWSDTEQKQYEQLLSTFPNPADRAAIHDRLSGFPDTIQDDMRSQCQLVSHGVTDDNDPRARDLLKDAHEWQLLFQVDSDEHAGMRWSSDGMLYYWIQRSDLQAHRFDQTWLVLQAE